MYAAKRTPWGAQLDGPSSIPKALGAAVQRAEQAHSEGGLPRLAATVTREQGCPAIWLLASFDAFDLF